MSCPPIGMIWSTFVHALDISVETVTRCRVFPTHPPSLEPFSMGSCKIFVIPVSIGQCTSSDLPLLPCSVLPGPIHACCGKQEYNCCSTSAYNDNSTYVCCKQNSISSPGRESSATVHASAHMYSGNQNTIHTVPSALSPFFFPTLTKGGSTGGDHCF